MKWIALLSIVVLSACTTVRTTEVVEYRQVTVQPVVEEVVVVDDDDEPDDFLFVPNLTLD